MTEEEKINTAETNQPMADNSAEKKQEIIYQPVDPMKFALLCMCVPFHGYEVWWLYKNFVCQKERSGTYSSPLWRVNMPILYLRKLLEAMREEGKPYGLAEQLPVQKIVLYWTLLVFLLILGSLVPPPLSIIGAFTFAPFIVVNEYLIKLNKAANPQAVLDTRYSLSDYLVIIFGGAYFALNIYMQMSFHL